MNVPRDGPAESAGSPFDEEPVPPAAPEPPTIENVTVWFPIGGGVGLLMLGLPQALVVVADGCCSD